MITSITKPKLRSIYTYVLHTSQLEEVLKDNVVETDVQLEYSDLCSTILDAHFWLPNKYNEKHRLYVRPGIVLKSDYPVAKDRLLAEVFPAFVNWIKSIEALDKSSTQYGERYFKAAFQNGHVMITQD